MERALFLEAWDQAPGEGEWPRWYIGSEWCPWLLPTPQEAASRAKEALERGAALTLATPFLRDDDLDRVERLVEVLAGPGFELVVNDWGLADLAGERRWAFPLSLGRLLVRGSAGVPRREASGGLAAYLGSGALDDPAFLDFARVQGISRVETDRLAPPPPAFVAEGFRASFHHPDGLVTVAGRCPWRFDGQRWETGPCPRYCREGEFTLRRDEDGLGVTVRGCVQVLRGEGLPDGPAGRGIDRAVLHPAAEEGA